jgi:hypothetical protein
MFAHRDNFRHNGTLNQFLVSRDQTEINGCQSLFVLKIKGFKKNEN